MKHLFLLKILYLHLLSTAGGRMPCELPCTSTHSDTQAGACGECQDHPERFSLTEYLPSAHCGNVASESWRNPEWPTSTQSPITHEICTNTAASSVCLTETLRYISPTLDVVKCKYTEKEVPIRILSCKLACAGF